jgi:GntR family transcriptional regulator, uxu operon transcriptional repressor
MSNGIDFGDEISAASPIRRAYQTVAEDLSRLIQEKHQIGDRLPAERELARRYGVSRPTVREALLALALAGMVEIRSKGGAYVVQRQAPADLLSGGVGPFETLEARLMIEPEVAAIATTKVSESLIAALAGAVADMREAREAGREPSAGDHRFHIALANATGNGMLVAVCDQLWRAQLDSPIWKNIHRRMRLERYWNIWLKDHEKILGAVKLGSPIQARIEMIRHLENVKEALLANSNKSPL